MGHVLDDTNDPTAQPSLLLAQLDIQPVTQSLRSLTHTWWVRILHASHHTYAPACAFGTDVSWPATPSRQHESGNTN